MQNLVRVLLSLKALLKPIGKAVKSGAGGFTAFKDIPNVSVPPCSGNTIVPATTTADVIDMEIAGILGQAGALRAKDLTNQRIIVLDDGVVTHHQRLVEECPPDCFDFDDHKVSSSSSKLDKSSDDMGGKISESMIIQSRSRAVLLLAMAVFATITYQVPFYLNGKGRKGYLDDNYYYYHHYYYNFLVLLNSCVFISSVCVTIFLLREFPLKPWPQISISALFGSYMFSIKAIASPNEALALFSLSIPFLALAAAGKLCGFA